MHTVVEEGGQGRQVSGILEPEGPAGTCDGGTPAVLEAAKLDGLEALGGGGGSPQKGG